MTVPGAEPPEAHGPAGHDSARGAGAGAPPVDPQVIADRVYELMRAELRLDRVRGGGVSHVKE